VLDGLEVGQQLARREVHERYGGRESRPLYSDLWDATTRELVEAKGSVTRDYLRQAVGQLLDYGRFANAASHAVLVPSRPRPDLLAYLLAADVTAVYPDGDRWVRVDTGAPSADEPSQPTAAGREREPPGHPQAWRRCGGDPPAPRVRRRLLCRQHQ